MPDTSRSVLVLARGADWVPAADQVIGPYALRVAEAASLAEAERLGAPAAWDVVAFQVERLHPLTSSDAMEALRAVAPEATFLAVTSRPDIHEAVGYLKQGVYEYLEEPLEPAEFLASVVEAIENRDAFREILSLNKALEHQKGRLEDEKAELERRNAELEAISRVARAVSSTLELDEILRQLAACLQDTFAFDRIFVGLVDARTHCEEAHVGLGVEDEGRDEFLRRLHCPLREGRRNTWVHTVLRQGQVLRVEDAAADPATRGTPLAEILSGPFVKLPLVARGHVVGSITVDNSPSRRAVNDEEVGVLRIIADTAAMAVENARLYGSMRDLSVRDELTGLYNRRHFLHQIDAECNHAERHESPLSLLMLDVDHFKLFNDRNDHLAGDAALRRVAGVFLRNTRGTDTVARYGGEEFVVLLPRTSKQDAWVVAEKLRRAVERTAVEGEEVLPGGKLTVSVGLASYPGDATEPRALLERADWSLYRAKAEGRNRVATWQEPLEARAS